MPAMPSAAPWESARHPRHPGHSAAAARQAAVPRCAESPLWGRHGGAEAPALRGRGRGDVPWKFPALCALAATEVVVFCWWFTRSSTTHWQIALHILQGRDGS